MLKGQPDEVLKPTLLTWDLNLSGLWLLTPLDQTHRVTERGDQNCRYQSSSHCSIVLEAFVAPLRGISLRF